MTGLYQFFTIACALVVATHAQRRQELSSFVTTLDLGRIVPVTEKKVLTAFVRLNPNLPDPLRDTRQETRLIYASFLLQYKAIIEVTYNENYTGNVAVHYNGGAAPAAPASPSHYGRDKFNLSRRTDLVTNLGLQKGGVRVTDDARGHAAIIEAFMSKNDRIPTGLSNYLRVGSMTRNMANLVVPQPNFEFEGNVNVSL